MQKSDNNETIQMIDKLVEEADQENLGGNYHRVIELYGKALDECSKIGKQDYIADIYRLIGVMYKKLSDHQRALGSYNRSLEICRKIKDDNGCAANYNNIGVIYKNLGQYEKALEFYYKSLQIRDELQDERNSTNVLNNIGVIYNLLGNFDKALEYFTRSLDIRLKTKDQAGIAASLNNLGNIYYKMKDFDTAIDYYYRSLQIKEEIGDKTGIAYSLNNIGVIFKNKGEFETALDHFKRSHEIKQAINDRQGIMSALVNIANIYNDLGEFDKSIFNTNNALEMAKTDKAGDLLVKCYLTFSEAYGKKGDFEKAFEFHKKYSQLKDKLLDEKSRSRISEIQTNYEIYSKQKEAEIHRLKNIKLVEANRKIRSQNKELKYHREHLRLINKILRHDLLNNLSATKSAINLFNHQGRKDMLDEGLTKINNSVKLIRQMKDLEFFISTHKGLKTYKLSDVFAKLIRNYSQMEFSVTGDSEIFADDSIYSVIENILNNAIVHAGVDKIDVVITEQDNWCLLKIADTGKGIPVELQDKVFEESFTYGDTGNTGLGLFIVKKAIERFGGSVYIENNKPSGTVFNIVLKKVK